MIYGPIRFYFKRFLLLFAISFLSLFTSSKDFSITSAGIFLFYALTVGFFLYRDCKRCSNILPLFELNKILVLVTSLIWACGILLALNQALILGHGLIGILISIDNKNICWFLTLVSLSTFFTVEKRCVGIVKVQKSKLGLYRILSAVLGYLFIVVAFLDIPLSAIGGSGNLSPQFYQTGAAIVFGSLTVLNPKVRIFFSAPILLTSIPLFYEEKRETIAIFLIYMVYNSKSSFFSRLPTIRRFLGTMVLGLFVVTVVLIQSIARGYGGFVQTLDDYSFFMAVPYLFEYLKDPLSMGYVANNFEISSVFVSGTLGTYIATQSLFSIENIGSTLVKVFYVPLTLFDVPKPESFISLVTTYISPSYRAEGGSYPAYLPSEIMYNLSFLLPLLPFVMAFVAFCYSSVSYLFLKSVAKSASSVTAIASSMLYSSVYIQSIFLWRGQGLDMMLVSILPALIGFFMLRAIVAISSPAT
jgi:hypothetical protein